MLRAYNQKLVERLEQRVRELSAANAELQELDQLKSQFLSTLSHELRTPLTSLLGYLELFDRGMLGELSKPADRGDQGDAAQRRHALAAAQQPALLPGAAQRQLPPRADPRRTTCCADRAGTYKPAPSRARA